MEIHRIEDCVKFIQWAINAKPNDKYIYFSGFSLADSFISIALQEITFDYACKGLIYLVQQRLKVHSYNFIAVKASITPIYWLIPRRLEPRTPTLSRPRVGTPGPQKRVLIPAEHLTIQGMN